MSAYDGSHTAEDQIMSTYTRLGLLIDGRWIEQGSAGSEEVLNPATEVSLGALPLAGMVELDEALHAAERSFASWRATSALERSAILRRAAHLVRERLEAIARVLTLEQGKTLAESRAEVTGAAELFEWFAEEGRRAYGRIIPARAGNTRQMVLQEPIGPVACFTPWNFPAVIPARKIGAVLAAGCTCIIKPSEETPGTALELARALVDAGLPNGVLNVVFGEPSQISDYLLRSPVVRKISFTGSTAVGKQLAGLASSHMKGSTMELGGHAPVIVCHDADVQNAVRVAMAGKLRNAGQVCVSPTRFFVDRRIYDEFVEQAAEFMATQRPGCGLDPDSTLGPLANSRRLSAMDELIADGLEHSARLIAGGRRLDKPGYFFEPAVLADVPDSAKAMSHEPFGPLALIQPVDGLEQAILKANALPYGLAAYAFTESAASANKIIDGLEAGVIGINHMAIATPEAPFGGIKDSGTGRESGIEGLEAYTISKYVTHRYA